MLSRIPLPKHWPVHVRSGVLHALALARAALTDSWGRATSGVSRRRLQAEIDRLSAEVACLKEELSIKDSRWQRHSPRRRPHYGPMQRMQILRLRVARGWSVAETAKRFLLTVMTIENWMRRLDEAGEAALVRLETPVNKYPDFVACLVRHLKALSPALGKVKIAQVLARAGLHVSASTVRRMLHREPSRDEVEEALPTTEPTKRKRTRRPGEVWHVDLTCAPTAGGFWLPFFPFTQVQRWPFCWWVAVCVDHASRRLVGFAVYKSRPASADVCAFLARAIQSVGSKPRLVLTDKGREFFGAFIPWCRRRGIRLRRGTLGQPGGICVIERFIRSMKSECTARMLAPFGLTRMRRELALYATWYNEYRPHSWLGGRTPMEVFEARPPAIDAARFEPRARWPRGVGKRRGRPGERVALLVKYVGDRRFLPVVELKRAA